MDELEQLLNSGDDWAAQKAQMALEVQQAVESGQMSADDAREILADLVDTDKLDQEAADDQMKAALVFGVTQLIAALA